MNDDGQQSGPQPSATLDYLVPANLTLGGRRAYVKKIQTYALDLARAAEDASRESARPGHAPEITSDVIEQAAAELSARSPAGAGRVHS